MTQDAAHAGTARIPVAISQMWKYKEIMKHAPCLVTLLLLVLPVAAQPPLVQSNFPAKTPNQQDTPAVRFGEKRAIHSQILNEDRPYWVYLPLSYQGSVDRRYSVLYLLDGDAHFEWVCGVVRFMSEINGNFQIPETIVVAIPNTQGNRTRDLTPTHTTNGYDGNDDPTLASSGGGRTFEKFLERELVPRIETDYRTAPYRIFVGHSLGGLLVLDTFLRQPAAFQAFIAIDPSVWWDGRLLLRMAKEILPKAPDLHQQVYLSLAKTPPAKGFDPKVVESASRDFVRLLQTNTPVIFSGRLDYFDAENHNSVPLLSLYHGLLFIFDGYKPPVSFEKRTFLQAHFKTVSERLGCELLPPEDFVNANGHYLLQERHGLDEAIECFKLNVKNYPNSATAYDSLGEAYAMRGEKSLAIRNYERAIELDPKRHDAIDALKKLK